MAEKFYITTAIAYVNAPPHIGYAMELVQADVIARWQKLHGREVYFLTGTDEHGAKIMRAAQAAGKEARAFVDGMVPEFKQLISRLDISNNDFIRTSDEKRHFPGAQDLWRQLEKAGDIYKKKYHGLYCVGHEAFVTQKDLVDGKCSDHGQVPERIEEENYFFRLSKYRDQILQAIESGEFMIFPESRKNEITSFLKEGLEDVSFSRPAKDISWGIAVPSDASQTMYVWCDALSNYITALGFGSDNPAPFEKFWPTDLHIIGKDILRFHGAIWPGMLLSAGLSLPKALFVHGFITSGGQKMSKTIGNVIDPFDIIKRYGKDPLRYYLLREIPTFEDGDFAEDRFVESYNAHLSNGLGNYISRVAKMIEEYFSGRLEKPSVEILSGVPIRKSSTFFTLKEAKSSELEIVSISYFIERFVWPRYEEAMKQYELKKAMDVIWEVLHELDAYVQTYEPFRLAKTDPEKTKAVLWNLAYGALSVAWLLQPFMPGTADKIFSIFGVDKKSKDEWREVTVKLDAPLFLRKKK